MAIQSNFPAIRPSLLLDFANSKRLDPRVTFTRASTARYYDGVTVAKAEENLLLRSQDYSATWTVTNLTPVTGKTAPDGTSTATEFTAGAANATLTQSVTAIAADYTFSVWLRRVTGTGNIDISAHSGGTWVTQSISGTWARYTVTQALTAGARTPGIRVVTSGDVIEVWGAQFELRSAVTDYTATTTAPITNYVPQLLTAQNNVPRFDHNSTTGESLGLLIEESRTNLALQSEAFGTTWTATRATVMNNTRIAPDGTLTSDRLIDTTDNNTHFVSQTFTGTAAAYTFSVYVKAAGYNFVALRLFNGTSEVGLAYYNLSTGATGTVSSGTASIVNVGNGWYRCILTATLAASASCTADIQLASADGTNSFAGDGWKSVALWGAQVELGAFATSYIPTTTATATRQVDAASMTGTNFSSWYDAAEGTLYYEGAVQFIGSATSAFLTISDNTTSNFLALRDGATGAINPNAAVTVAGTNLVNIALSPSSTPTEFFRAAMAYKLNDTAASKSGGAAVTDTSVTIPVVDRLYFGGATAGSAGRAQRVRKVAYYPLRITDAQLSAITG